jgi:3-isopropylmalate/(R)-2-methylmalate dehydratase small subunit
MFNCGMIAAELPGRVIDHLFESCADKSTTVNTDIEQRVFQIKADGFSEEIPFELPDFDLALVIAGGWLEYADARY